MKLDGMGLMTDKRQWGNIGKYISKENNFGVRIPSMVKLSSKCGNSFQISGDSESTLFIPIQVQLILLRFVFIVFLRHCIFYKFKVCGNPESRKSIWVPFF